jgi:hypothetical protein
MNYIAKFFKLTARRVTLVTLSLLTVIVTTSLFPSPAIQAQNPQIQQIAQVPSDKPNDVVLNWNAIALNSVQTAGSPPPQAYRTLSITHAAIFDAVNSIERKYKPYAIAVNAPSGSSPEAAAVVAGHGVLSRIYPAQKSSLDPVLESALAKIADGQSKLDGIKIGQEVAEKLVELRSNDNANKKGDYQVPKEIGIWQPTLPLFAPALLPFWSEVTPFTFKDGSQFRVPEPLPLKSASYAKELNEVKAIGARNSTIRTADQTAAGIWSAIPPATIWNTAAKSAAIAKGNSLIENARLFTLINFAGVDAYIAGYGVKYKYKLWRPVTAIPNADQIGNPAIAADPNWEPLIVTPAHPDYISGHTVTAGASEKVLQSFFGNDAVKLSLIFPANAGVTRSFSSFSQIAAELVESRVWAGVHTRTSDVQGRALGNQVGEYIAKNSLQPA